VPCKRQKFQQYLQSKHKYKVTEEQLLLLCSELLVREHADASNPHRVVVEPASYREHSSSALPAAWPHDVRQFIRAHLPLAKK